MKRYDLRSDTFTLPSEPMRKAMYEAEVGDDVYGEDPTVNRLQEMVEEITGKERSLLISSGCMGNLIPMMIKGGRGKEILTSAYSHIVRHEIGAISSIAATLPVIVPSDMGIMKAEDVEANIHGYTYDMSETAMILRSATRRSLVIMDEIGRGTSTEDGMSIAFAVMEYMKKLGAITLFATHYHELTMLDTSGIQLLHMAVREERSTITFLRKAEPGVSASSYGIHVAKLAGLPKEVVRDAAQFQRRHFADYSFDTSQGDLFIDNEPVREPGTEEEVIDDIMAFDTDSSTPLEALMFINGLKGKLERRPVDTDRHI